MSTSTGVRPRKSSEWRSGHCNRYMQVADQNHDRCGPENWPVGMTCQCECHQRYAVAFTTWDGTAQMEAGFRNREDVETVLVMLKRLELIPADSETWIEMYVGEPPW